LTHDMQVWQEGTLGENLERAGVSRRDFLAFCGKMAAIFAVGSYAGANSAMAAPTAEEIATKLSAVTKPVVVWLQLQECTGCAESAIRSYGTTVEEIVLKLLSVEYFDLLMAPSGTAAEEALHNANQGPHILVVNGSVPLNENGIHCVIGGKTAKQVLEEAAENATHILAMGACAVWGSVQASHPNPTGAVGVDSIIRNKPVINVAGCPPIGDVMTAVISYVLTYDAIPKLDGEGRPKFAYDQRVHDSCERRPHFDAGQFVRNFDDEAARNGWCLYNVGCKGPSTYSPCPIVQWNLRASWPVAAGHPCIGCTEKDFYDRFTPFYETLPNVGIDPGIEATSEAFGLGLLGITTAGVAAHAGITAALSKKDELAQRQAQPLEAFGDAVRSYQSEPETTQGESN
jgi:hydrogenase small subunit